MNDATSSDTARAATPGHALWLFRCVGASALAALAFVTAHAARAVAAGTWLAVPDLGALELSVMAALAVAALSLYDRGRRVLGLDACERVARWQRIVWTACASHAALLGILPGLGFAPGPPIVWPLASAALLLAVARAVAITGRRRFAWLLCACYGLAATASLVAIRHVL